MVDDEVSFRADLVTRRTYCRPYGNGVYESWTDVVFRVISHQRWLWERAAGRPLTTVEEAELTELSELMLRRVALPSGRILWMGGTEQARKTEIAMFNCSFAEVRDVYSAVDAFYLLLNGCGVGFKPVVGLLNGFSKEVDIFVHDFETLEGGMEFNDEIFFTDSISGKKVWRLSIGDSGVAWAKAFGKLLAMKKPVDEIHLNFGEIRPAGKPLAGYGWLSSGSIQIKEAFIRICQILNDASERLLTEMDILDLINLVGTTLTSRRSAEIAMMDYTNENALEFADAKSGHYEKGLRWRSQSNNSLVFWTRPSKLELIGLFSKILSSGGSEPGFYNGEAARRRAPWFAGTNPCGEILLPDGGLCNLVELDIGKFTPDTYPEMYRAMHLIARANYRQTCVSLKDGVLSERYHETQEFLRLCGAGLTGIVRWLDNNWQNEYAQADTLKELRYVARSGAFTMADELGLPRPKAVTTVKPSGTLSKIMDTTEGLHRPIGRYIFNWITFHKDDAALPGLQAAGYNIKPNPYSPQEVIVCVPYDNGDMNWSTVDGVEINRESAVDQLNRYKFLMDNYVDHNASITISYSPNEVPEIVNWLHANWDTYVGVSFILRTDPTKTAEDLGYPYLPQEVVSAQTYNEYVSALGDVRFEGGEMLPDMGDCATGACPIR